jgi:acetylornithine deacetylase/succinyl-diaminopimelate desuccinylase-like protein
LPIKLKDVDAVFCLDSDSPLLDRLWITPSLRGVVNFALKAKVLKDPVHSGDAGGIVPETFSICRTLLNRLEDPKTGKMNEQLHVEIPEMRKKEVEKTAFEVTKNVIEGTPKVQGLQFMETDLAELQLNKTWRPCMAIIGAEGFPVIANAGNVLRSSTTLMISIRLPPTLKAKNAAKVIEEILTKDPPYGAEITVDSFDYADGWNAPEYSSSFNKAINKASNVFLFV